jgi:signal transduction histidine kinase
MAELDTSESSSSRQFVEGHLKTTIEDVARVYSQVTKSTFTLVLDGEKVLEISGAEHGQIAPTEPAQTMHRALHILGIGDASISSTRLPTSATDSPTLGEAERKKLLDAICEVLSRLISCAFTTQFLVANNVHEAMTGLSAIAGAAEYLAHVSTISNWKDNPQIINDIFANAKTIFDQVQLSMSMISNLMEVASGDLQPDAARPKLSPLDLGAEITRAVGIWSGTAARRGVSLRFSLERDVRINADLFQLRHLLDNLLSNAIKYSYRTTERSDSRFVSIAVRRYDAENTRIGVYITNYGVGLEREEQARIGEVGFRGRLARREQPMGFGIGVFVARRIARMHGGFVRYKWSLLHEQEPSEGGPDAGSGGTYLVECVLVLPILGRTRRSTSAEHPMG